MARHTVPLRRFASRHRGIRSQLTKAICGTSLALLTLAETLPAQANTTVDLETLIQTLTALGTKVEAGNCEQKNLYGFYVPKKDQMVICVDSISGKDPSVLWDTLAHESTHKMQACIEGRPVMPPEYVGAMMRELKAIYPETLKDLDGYPSGQMRFELEARWMALQTPATVLQLLVTACRRA
jgi:hypothetical protein